MNIGSGVSSQLKNGDFQNFSGKRILDVTHLVFECFRTVERRKKISAPSLLEYYIQDIGEIVDFLSYIIHIGFVKFIKFWHLKCSVL
jgi:hypothetical protein